jgi:hypothetical protein
MSNYPTKHRQPPGSKIMTLTVQIVTN